MPLTEKQYAYLRNCNHRWNVKTGATGSGKSFVDMAVTIPQRIMHAHGEGLFVLMGNTRGTLERNILEPMREIWSRDLIGQIRSDNTVDVFGQKCYALGADNKKHVARIQGATMEYVYGDEVTTWSEDVFQMLKSRLRCGHSHFDGTCNPDNPKHWFKKFLNSEADIYQQSYVIDDGVLPPDIVSQLKREYSGTVYYDRYIRGLWVAAEGVIYRHFADNPERLLLDAAPPVYRAAIGVDFGGGTSGHAFSCVGYMPMNKGIVVLDEYYCKEALDPAKLERDFVDFVKRCLLQGYPVCDIWCDSAEQTLINGLRTAAINAGLPVNIGNAMKKGINDRIRAACILQASGRFLIMRRCEHTIDAYQSAVWDSKNPTEDVRLDDGTTNIDSLDATEYAYEREINVLIENFRR